MNLNKLLRKILRRKPPVENKNLPIVNKGKYPDLTDNIPWHVVKILHKLQKNGHQGYLVGGCIRDLLLRITPKDLDIATSATPEQMAKLFRNCRIIGRRFKLAHLLFKRSIIEVATFRQGQEHEDQHQDTNDLGMLVRDNAYGTIELDAWRRDFTINSLYYDATSNVLLDFTGGFTDLQHKLLRIIGDPEQRYVEDPVRMLRALRFSAKLGFTIEENTAKAIHQKKPLIRHVASSRLTDEVLKLLASGNGCKVYQMLEDFQVFEIIFPATAKAINDNQHYQQIIKNTLLSTDKRIKQQKPTAPAFLFAALLWPALQQKISELSNKKMMFAKKFDLACENILNEQKQITAISKRFIKTIKEIWHLQHTLTKLRKRTSMRLITHPRFRAGYDFLLIRAAAGDADKDNAAWWTKFQEVDDATKQLMVNELSE